MTTAKERGWIDYALRTVLILELAGVSFLITYGVLNAPVIAKQVAFSANGQDLSANVSGTYVPPAELPTFTLPDVSKAYPPLTISVSPIVIRSAAASSSFDPDLFLPNTVTVPRIGVRAPLVDISVNTEQAEQVGLERGVIHMAGTPGPGEDGNAFYAGHSSDFLLRPGNYKTIFALLPELEKGDYFILSDKHTMYYYTVRERLIVNSKDTSVLNRGGTGGKFASLQTSYPVGTAFKRFVLIGEMTNAIRVK